MWSGFVSIIDAVLNRAIFRFIEIIWRYPAVGATFLAAFLILAALLWLEVLKDGTGEPSDASRLTPARR